MMEKRHTVGTNVQRIKRPKDPPPPPPKPPKPEKLSNELRDKIQKKNNSLPPIHFNVSNQREPNWVKCQNKKS